MKSGLYNKIPFGFGYTADGQPGYIVTDEGGADSVRPFKRMVIVAEGLNSDSPQWIDCASVNGYKNMTADDFMLEITAFKWSSYARLASTIQKTYDADTGVLSVSAFGSYETDYKFFIVYRVVVNA